MASSWSVGPSVTLELKSGETPLPTRPQLVAVYPALFRCLSLRYHNISLKTTRQSMDKTRRVDFADHGYDA